MFHDTQAVCGVIFLCTLLVSEAFPGYEQNLPNGDALAGQCGGLGHTSCNGGGSLNKFGQDFQGASNSYTGELCLKDSDSDGLTNGDEMGDPCCMWRSGGMTEAGSESLLFSANLSLPGDASSRSSRPSCSAVPEPIANVEAEAGTEKVLLKWPSSLNPGCLCRSSLSIRFKVPGNDSFFESNTSLIWGARQAVLCPSQLAGIAAATEFMINVTGHNLHSSVDGPELTIQINRSFNDIDNLPCTDFNSTFVFVLPEDPPAEAVSNYEHIAIASNFVAIFIPFITYHIVKLMATPRSSLYQKLFRPWLILQLTLGNIIGIAILLGVFVAYVLLMPTDTDFFLANTFGTLAGFAAWLPMAWALYGRTRIFSLLGMSLEYSWRIHAVLGFFFMVTAVVHGSLEIRAWGIDYIMETFSNICGLVAVILIIVGSLPATLHRITPRFVKYDMFKLMHFVAPLGYVFGLLHLFNHKLPLAIINALFLFLWIASKIWEMMRGGKASVKEVKEVDSDYLALTFAKVGFACRPGQWIRLSIRGQAVAHPFTVVPYIGLDDSSARNSIEGKFRLIIRAGKAGTFTGRLRAKVASGVLPSEGVHIVGPYGDGIPSSLDSMKAFAFVIGGVGITPALSLIPALLRRLPAPEVRLLWFVRSEDMVKECLPYLELLPEGKRAIVLTQGGQKKEDEQRPNVGGWLQSTATEFTQAGHAEAGIFVCGPASIAQDALKCSSQGPFQWHLHAETFRFLLG